MSSTTELNSYHNSVPAPDIIRVLLSLILIHNQRACSTYHKSYTKLYKLRPIVNPNTRNGTVELKLKPHGVFS